MAYIGREPTYGSLVKQNLTPNGSTTNFTLNYSVSTASSLIVSVGGVLQNPDTAYTITNSGATLSFTEAPAADLDVFVVYLGIQVVVGTVGDETITSSKLTANVVTTSKLAANAVTTGILDGEAVTTGIIADNAVTAAKLAANAVTTGIVADNAITTVKLANTFAQPAFAQSFTATQTFTGNTSAIAVVLTDAAEVATVSATAATGTINYDITTQSVLYYTSNASANWTTNFRASSGTSLNTALATGQSVTVAFLVTQGATAYYNNVVQVDGTTSGVTTRWIGGAPTAGNASGIDSYRYLIIKTGSATFTVLASVTQFKA